jgi:hypothetical protein
MFTYTEVFPHPAHARFIESRAEATVAAYIRQAIAENKPYPPIRSAIVRYKLSGFIQITIESENQWLAVFEWDFIHSRPRLIDWSNHNEGGSLSEDAPGIRLLVIREMF